MYSRNACWITPLIGMHTIGLYKRSFKVEMSEFGKEISKIPGVMGGSLLSEQAGPIQRELAKWVASFPPVLQLNDPDTQYDADYHDVVFQRYQLNSIGQMLSFVPVKLSLAKPVDSTTTAADMEMRKRRSTAPSHGLMSPVRCWITCYRTTPSST